MAGARELGMDSCGQPARGYLPAATALSSSSDSLMSWARSGPSGAAIQLREGDPEDGQARLGRQGRGRVGDAPAAQRVGDRGGDRRQLDQLALAQVGVGGDDGRPPPDAVLVRREHGGRGVQGPGDRVDRRGGIGGAGDAGHEELLEPLRAREQDLALVREVAEERPLGEPRPLGDLGHRHLLEAALGEELERRLSQPAARARLPSHHALMIRGLHDP